MTEINPDAHPDVPPLARLRARGYDVLCTSHSEAILASDFPDALADVEAVLGAFTINVEEVVRGGGGETPFTQRLRRALVQMGWTKREFVIRKLIDEVETQATSHEVDHVKRFEKGTVAMEIEWNNKDPFYDRDLDNFKRLHADGGISAGIIITRGTSLHDNIRPLLTRFGTARGIREFAQLEEYDYFPTRRQRSNIEKRVQSGASFVDAWVSVFTSDKFGEATTHWRKLEDRVTRGAGNPCPLVLIGLPAKHRVRGTAASRIMSLAPLGENDSRRSTKSARSSRPPDFPTSSNDRGYRERRARGTGQGCKTRSAYTARPACGCARASGRPSS